MTTANKVTILRILLVPFFVVFVLYYVDAGQETYRLLAMLTFGLAALSDGVDGYIARHYKQHSELGRILDPLADKLLLVSGVVLLSLDNAPYLPRIPLWVTATILSRDVLLLVGLVVIHFVCGRIIVRPVLLGKMATVMQITCVLWALLKNPGWLQGATVWILRPFSRTAAEQFTNWNPDWFRVWAILAAVCTALSAVFYVRDGIRQLSASPSSSATPKQ